MLLLLLLLGVEPADVRAGVVRARRARQGRLQPSVRVDRATRERVAVQKTQQQQQPLQCCRRTPPS